MIGGAGLLVALVGLCARAEAQSPLGSVSADAVVVTVGMTIAVVRDLDFGTVLKGVATTVQPTAANAGAWQVTGSQNGIVIIAFTLPTVLTNMQAAPGSTMPITFAANAARWRRANTNPVGGIAFNPNNGTFALLGPAANPTLNIWIGGTVTPAAAAKPGIYRGTIVVSLNYF